MRLAQLAYECVRDSITLPNTNFDLKGFISGSYDNDLDYANQISAVMSYVNLAFSRLISYDKIPFRTEYASVSNGLMEFNGGDVRNVVKEPYPEAERYPFNRVNNGKYAVKCSDGNVYVEYAPRIPHFGLDSFRSQRIDPDTREIEVVEREIDLEHDYGISDSACDYVKEFVKAQAMEYIAPDMSALHFNRAEQYMRELPTYTTAFYQAHIQGGFGSL